MNYKITIRTLTLVYSGCIVLIFYNKKQLLGGSVSWTQNKSFIVFYVTPAVPDTLTSKQQNNISNIIKRKWLKGVQLNMDITVYECMLSTSAMRLENSVLIEFCLGVNTKDLWPVQYCYAASVVPISLIGTPLVIELEVLKYTVKIYFHNSPIKRLIALLAL